MTKEQSILVQIAPKQTDEVIEKLQTKNALSVVLNRLREVEQEADQLLTKTQFLIRNIEEYFNEN